MPRVYTKEEPCRGCGEKGFERTEALYDGLVIVRCKGCGEHRRICRDPEIGLEPLGDEKDLAEHRLLRPEDFDPEPPLLPLLEKMASKGTLQRILRYENKGLWVHAASRDGGVETAYRTGVILPKEEPEDTAERRWRMHFGAREVHIQVIGYLRCPDCDGDLWSLHPAQNSALCPECAETFIATRLVD